MQTALLNFFGKITAFETDQAAVIRFTICFHAHTLSFGFENGLAPHPQITQWCHGTAYYIIKFSVFDFFRSGVLRGYIG